MPRIPHFRWWVITRVLLAAVLNYVDRHVRFALGLGEAGVWPAASKVVSEWLPAQLRGGRRAWAHFPHDRRPELPDRGGPLINVDEFATPHASAA